MIPEKPVFKEFSPILSHVISTYQSDYDLVGEAKTIGQVFLNCLSRHLPPEYRRHYLSTGESGSGKSTIVKRILKPFGSDVESYTRITGAGLDRRTETFDGKILLIEQILGAEPMQLSFLMSEGELSVLSSERDEKTGKMVSKQTRLKGEPVVVSTLTGATVGPQFVSRTSTGKIDESEQQTRAISKSKLSLWKNVDRRDPARRGAVIFWIDKKCRELSPSVRAVQAPWAEALENSLPPVLSMRRGLPKLSSLVNVICFLKSALGLRPMVKTTLAAGVVEHYLICDPEDLQDAVAVLGEEDLIESISGFFAKSKSVYNFLLSNESATSKDVSVGLKLGQNTAGDYLRSLTRFGHATRVKVGGEYHYTAVPQSLPSLQLGPQFMQKLRTDYSREALRLWFQENFPNDNANLLLPGADILSGIVSVPMPSKQALNTVNESVPDPGTLSPTVPNLVPDGHSTDAGKVMETPDEPFESNINPKSPEADSNKLLSEVGVRHFCELCGRPGTPLVRLGESTVHTFCQEHMNSFEGDL